MPILRDIRPTGYPFDDAKSAVGYLFPVVGIVTRRHNGVTNWPLPILFKTITSYKSSRFTLLKALSVVKKKNLTALQSYKSSKAITLYIATSYMLKIAFIKD
jgi:hypothetical protein